MDGEVVAVGSVTLACLSCHDGYQAMDNLINAPGSGGYDSTGGGATGLGYTWSAGGEIIGTTDPIPRIGVNLRDDHPIGIPYCGGASSYTSAALTGCADGDFVSSGWSSKTINSQTVYWLDGTGTTAGIRDKQDVIFYTRTDFSGGSAQPSVECGSCHDPHVESKGTENIMFMRVATAGSAICLACHVK